MDLTKYKNQVQRLKQCITNVEVAQEAYRKAEENCSYGVLGSQEQARIAKENLETAQTVLETQFRIAAMQINMEVSNV